MNNEELVALSRKAEAEAMGIFEQGMESGAEDKKRRIEKAGKVLEASETEGGKFIIEEMNRLIEMWDLSPEQMFRETATGENIVDVTLVARSAGGRQGLQAVLAWIEACKKTVERAAQESLQKE